MRKALLITILLFSSVFAFAQIGIMGKRVLVKTDIVNGLRRPISLVEVEGALTRKFSIALNYSFFDMPMNAQFKTSNFAYWMNYSSQATWDKYLPGYDRSPVTYGSSAYEIADVVDEQASFKANPTITGKQKVFGVLFNFYGGGAISAPNGGYFQLGVKTGKQSISGSVNVPYLTGDANYYGNLYYSGMKSVKFKDVEVRLTSLILGGGKHYLLHPRVMLDLNYGTSLNITTTGGNDDISLFSSLVARRNGANIYALANGGSSAIDPIQKTSFNFGLFLNVKLGVLLF
jgi:hypothetical protein